MITHSFRLLGLALSLTLSFACSSEKFLTKDDESKAGKSAAGTEGASLASDKITPSVSSFGSGCDDNMCIWIKGTNFRADAYVDVRSVDSDSILSSYRGGDRQIQLASPHQISIRLKTDHEKRLFSTEGLRVWVINPSDGTWSGGSLVRNGALTTTAAGAIWKGGSNYAITTAGEYLTNPNEDTWTSGVKPVIGTYHHNPDLVRSQLRAMYRNGQRQIALFLWYTQIPEGQGTERTRGHVVSSRGGALSEQHKQNLRNLIRDVENTGFTSLQFRFANQGSCWTDADYQVCWNFVYNTTKLVLSSVTKLDTIFDLDNESGGKPDENLKVFSDRLWWDFNRSDLKNSAKTYAFSMQAAPGRLTELVRGLDKRGPRPRVYAFTIYDQIYQRLKEISRELNALGEKGKEIIIQETYFNDAFVAEEFRRASVDFGLKIRCIMQWPLARGATQKHFSMNATPGYQYFGGEPGPIVDSTGSGCDDGNCIWIRGRNFKSDSHVDVRSVGSGSILSSYRGGDRMVYLTNPNSITIRLKTDDEKRLFSTEGLRVWVVNPSDGTWSSGSLVRK